MFIPNDIVIRTVLRYDIFTVEVIVTVLREVSNNWVIDNRLYRLQIIKLTIIFNTSTYYLLYANV